MSRSSFPRGLTAAQRHSYSEWRRANPHAHEDAMDDLLQRDSRAIGREIGLSGSTLRDWRNRHDSDHRGPGRTIALAIRAALEVCGRPLDEAIAPVRALADEFGFDLVARRPSDPDAGTVMQSVAEAVRECGEASATALDAVRDGRIDQAELEACDRVLAQATESLHDVRRGIEAMRREELPS